MIYDRAVASGTGITDPKARQALEHLRGRSKAALVAKQLLDLPAR